MAEAALVGRRIGGYQVHEVLGQGAFATVYRARQDRLERDVAFKVLHPMLAHDPTAATRFEREGAAAARLDHPSIVPVYEAGDENGVVYLSMRLVIGPTLEQARLAAGGQMDRAEILRVVRPLAGALDHAHAQGVVHRDVKPSNVMLEGEHVWLTDFGIAVSTHAMTHLTAGVIGTVHYMSPEQAQQQAVDGRSDFYSLGCVVYELLTGRPPFDATEMSAVVLQHLTELPPPTGEPALDWFLRTAMAKHPDERFADGPSFVGWLAHGLGIEPPGAVPTATPSPPDVRDEPASPPPDPVPSPPADDGDHNDGDNRRHVSIEVSLSFGYLLLGLAIAAALVALAVFLVVRSR